MSTLPTIENLSDKDSEVDNGRASSTAPATASHASMAPSNWTLPRVSEHLPVFRWHGTLPNNTSGPPTTNANRNPKDLDGEGHLCSQKYCSTPVIVLMLVGIALFIAVLLLSGFLTTEINQNDKLEVELDESEKKISDLKATVANITSDRERLALDFLSHRIHSYIDYRTNPCEDMYKFACGGWRSEHRPRPSDASGGLLTFLNAQTGITALLKTLLETPISKREPSYIQEAKKLYTSCMNTDVIERVSATPLKKVLTAMGGWPLIDASWDERTYKLVHAVATIHPYMRSDQTPLVGISVNRDPVNNKDIITAVSHNPFPKIWRNSKKIYSLYIAAVVANFTNGHSTVNDKEIVGLIANIWEFQEALFKIYPNPTKLGNSTVTLKQFHTMYSSRNKKGFDWRRFVNTISSRQVRMDDMLYVGIPGDYFKKLNKLLHRWDAKTVASYVGWKFVESHLSTLDTKYVLMKLGFDYLLTHGRNVAIRWPLPPSWKSQICVEATKEQFSLAVSRMFVQNGFDHQDKETASEMVSDIMGAFDTMIEELDWVKAATKQGLKSKKDHMTKTVGYPTWIFNDTFVEKIQINYIIKEQADYASNILGILKQKNTRDWTFLHNPPAWVQDIEAIIVNTPNHGLTEINAFYVPTHNHMYIPAAFLQLLLFNRHYPASVNYGGVGSVIGHEIMHGFGKVGMSYNKDGVLDPTWLKDKDFVAEFKTRARCLVHQFGKFNITYKRNVITLNGTRTLEENISDGGGLNMAYRAYNEFISKARHGRSRSVNTVLPGSNFTDAQLFFISYAQVWCSVETEIRKYREMFSDHSPGRFRVLGTLANSEEFAQAFQCPEGSPMNPTQKCHLWA